MTADRWRDTKLELRAQFARLRTSELVLLLVQSKPLYDIVEESLGFDRANPNTWLSSSETANYVVELQNMVMGVLDERVPVPKEC